MSHLRLLLLSNSKNYGGEYLAHAEDAIKAFLGPDVREVLFVPFAGVRISFDAYTAAVRERFAGLGYDIRSVHEAADAAAAVEEAQAIAVGGGNTFHLLATLYDRQLLEPIRSRVHAGIPYLGWSAGSNVTCPTIKTTNDMPIAEPSSFEALGFVPFQINPHYTDTPVPQHGGETRAERLLEFVEANPTIPVIGLREGSILRLEGATLSLLGDKPARVFAQGRDPVETRDDHTLRRLLQMDL
jgi:dipeptidase E